MRRLRVVLIAGLLLCPLFDAPGYGFDGLRLPIVLALAAGLLGLSFLRSARGGERPPEPAPLRTAAMFLLGAHLLSLPAARSASDGIRPILVLLAGVSVFASLRGGILKREGVASLVPVISASALAFALVGIAQALGHRQAVATEGNRNYAGAVAAMLLPATVAFTRTGRSGSRLLAALAAAALVVELLLTESRAGIVAASAGLAIAGAAMLWRRVPGGAAGASAAMALLLGLAAGLQGRKQLGPERAETVGVRLEVWKSGLRMFLDRPWLGRGAGSFPVEYPPYRSEAEFRLTHKYAADPETLVEVEDAHSSWVETAVDTGVPGLLALLLVVYVAARLWRYAVKVAPDGEAAALLAGLGGGAAAYLVAGGFNTLTLKTTPTLLFWSFLGLIEIAGELRPWRRHGPAREVRVAIPAAGAILALFGAVWAWKMGSAQYAHACGRIAETTPETRERYFREALEDDPYHWAARHDLARVLAAQGKFRAAVEEGRTALARRPFQVAAMNNVAVWLLQSKGDENEARGLLSRATGVAPGYSKTWYNLGLLDLQRHDYRAARASFTRALELNPAAPLPVFYRGGAWLEAGEGGEAAADFRKARERGLDVAARLRVEYPSTEGDPRFAEFFR